MDPNDDYDDRIAVLEAKVRRAEKERKELERDKTYALEDVERANTELCEREADVKNKSEEIARLHETIERLKNDLRYERRNISDTTDNLQKAWAELKKLKGEYAIVVSAFNEAKTQQYETQQQLDEAIRRLQGMQAELDKYGALQKAAVDAEKAQAELHCEIDVLHNLGNPERRKIIILTERNTVLEEEKTSLTRQNRLLKRAIKGESAEDVSPEELFQLDTTSSPTESSLAEELDGHDYDVNHIDYESDSTVDSPVEVVSVATQTKSLPAMTTSSATQCEAPQPTVEASIQTDAVGATSIPTISLAASSQTKSSESPRTSCTSASTQTGVVQMYGTDAPISEEVRPGSDCHSVWLAFLVACCVFVMVTLMEESRTAREDDSGHGYGYGTTYIDGSGAYGNGRYLFNTIPMAMNLGGYEPLTSFSSRLIACVEKWTGSEPALLY